MSRNLTAEQRLDAVLQIGRTTLVDVGGVLQLRAGGVVLATTAQRDELLAKCVAGEYVELEIDMLSYEQRPGVQNRKFVRIRDGAMLAFGRSGVGKPFLRDHEQRNSLARGGTIIASATEKRGEGDYVVKQTARLTAPWAVDLALRGLMTTLSVGIYPTGPVLCSHCGTEVLEDCWHWPGDELEAVAGAPREVIEWVFTAADNIETSNVNVPAVPTTAVEGIRAALSAALSAHRGTTPQENHVSFTRIAGLLALAATAGETEIFNAVETQRTQLAAANAELAIARSELAVANGVLTVLKADQAKAAEQTFITEALATGRIAPADEKQWRTLFGLSAERARELMAERPASIATPLGTPAQSLTKPPAVAVDLAAQHAEVHSTIVAFNPLASFDGVVNALMKMGRSREDAVALAVKQIGKGA